MINESPAIRALEPVPWLWLVLSLLPGPLMMLPSLLIVLTIAALAGPGVVGLIVAIRRRSIAEVPQWSFVSIGWLTLVLLFLAVTREEIIVSIGLALLVGAVVAVVWRERPGRPPAASLGLFAVAAAGHLFQLVLLGDFGYFGSLVGWMTMVPAAALCLLLAPIHGLRAALVILPAGGFMMSFDIEHTIYFWEAPSWSQMLDVAMPILFLIVGPAWVLRARSLPAQALGLVFPAVLYGVLLIIALASDSFVTGWHNLFSIARPTMVLFTVLAIVGGVCVWLWQGNERETAIGDNRSMSVGA
jgi:hypothetical protein